MNLNLKLKSFFLASMAVGTCTASLCKHGKVPINDEPSWWRKRPSHPSCRDTRGGGYRSDGFYKCKGDETSISLDMSYVGDKQGCYFYDTHMTHNTGYDFKFKAGTEITFDGEWEGCEGVWMSPLWVAPTPWIGPQGMSGELEFMETTAYKTDVCANIMCHQHTPRNNQCYEPRYGKAKEGSGHFIGKVDASGTWTMDKCDLDDHSKCETISRYPDFLSKNYGSTRDSPFTFHSDLFNGGAEGEVGDGGWGGNGRLNLETNCKYTIANIKVEHRTPDPSPSPTPGQSSCLSWCSDDLQGGVHSVSEHCDGGHMAWQCGGCSYCKSPSPSPTPGQSNCLDWCAGDWDHRRAGRHCDPNDSMYKQCGGCSYCSNVGSYITRNGKCNDWCEADRVSAPGREGRHCGGNMMDLCGDCPYCHAQSTRSEL